MLPIFKSVMITLQSIDESLLKYRSI
jgi:DUF1680 family protein